MIGGAWQAACLLVLVPAVLLRCSVSGVGLFGPRVPSLCVSHVVMIDDGDCFSVVSYSY